MDILIGILAAWGLIMLLWTLAGALFLPLSRREDTRLTVLIESKGDAPRLEHFLKGVIWLRDMGLIWWNVVILSDHLSQEARQRAERLTEEQNVAVLTMDTLQDWMEK